MIWRYRPPSQVPSFLGPMPSHQCSVYGCCGRPCISIQSYGIFAHNNFGGESRAWGIGKTEPIAVSTEGFADSADLVLKGSQILIDPFKVGPSVYISICTHEESPKLRIN